MTVSTVCAILAWERGRFTRIEGDESDKEEARVAALRTQIPVF